MGVATTAAAGVLFLGETEASVRACDARTRAQIPATDCRTAAQNSA